MTLPDIDSLQTFGGQLNDYQIPVVDPTTDRPAAGTNQAYSSIAMLTHTVARAWARITLGNPPSLVQIGGHDGPNQHDAMWGSAPGIKPTIARTTTGVFTVTWPTTVTDEMGVSHTVALRTVYVSSEGPTNGFVTATVSGTVATILTFNTSNAANDLTGNTVFVEVT